MARAENAVDVHALAAGVRSGDARAIAQAISLIEDAADAGPALLSQLFPHAGGALVIGITGPPGSGKSTLVDRLTARWRAAGKGVGVIAVDPTSPFSGGAILGDRIRMHAHAVDEGVFIRSMATRGRLGGLAAATLDALTVLGAAGKQVLLVETVGVGQAEVEIAQAADVTLVVWVPGLGDEVQALKAGVMEIADIFVVNKADREGTGRLVAELETLLALAPAGAVRPSIVQTIVTSDQGVDELVLAIERFRVDAESSGRAADRRRAQMSERLERALDDAIRTRVEARLLGAVDRGAIVERLLARELDPARAAEELLRGVGL